MRNVAQSNYTNPGIINKYHVNVSLPSVKLGYYNSAFNLKDIYTKEGSTVIFDVGNVISEMDDLNNRLLADLNADILAAAIQFGKIQVGVNYGIKTNASITYPKGLFHFLWNGNADTEGEMLQFGPGIDFSAFHEIGVNVAFQVNERFSVGTRMRLLGGLLSAHTESSTIELITDQENYGLTANTDYRLLSAGLQFDDVNGLSTEQEIFEGAFGSNKGFAIDLGATYSLGNKLELQASILDLGSINWDSGVQELSSQGSMELVAVDIANMVNGEDGETAVLDTLSQVFNFENTSSTSSYKTSLGAKTYVSATFKPVKGLYLGALLYGEKNRTGFSPSFALSVNKEFGKVFSTGLVYSARKNAIGNLGMNMSLRFIGLQFFAVTDNVFTLFNVTKGNYYNYRFGVNLAFAKDKSKEKKIK